MEIKGVQHVNINCSDLQKSKAFYELLGFEEWFPLEADSDPEGNDAIERSAGIPAGSPCHGLYMRLGKTPYDAYLDLLEWPKKDENDNMDPGVPYEHLRHLGIARMAIWCRSGDEWTAMRKKLEDAGVQFVGKYSDMQTKMGHQQVAMFYDPDGTVIEMSTDWPYPPPIRTSTAASTTSTSTAPTWRSPVHFTKSSAGPSCSRSTATRTRRQTTPCMTPWVCRTGRAARATT